MSSLFSYKKILFLIIGSALFLRLWGIDYGLPYVVHPDERNNYLGKAIFMLCTRDFNPGNFVNPPLLAYVYAFIMASCFIFAKIFGIFLSREHFVSLFMADPSLHYIIARALSALLGAVSCIILYRLTTKLFNRTTGILASALLAFSFINIRQSHLAVNDTMAIFFIIASFNYIIDIYTYGGSRNSLWGGFFAGLAVATKYNAIFIVPTLLLAHFFSINKKDILKRVTQAAIICGITFIIFCPWVILEYKTFFKTCLGQVSPEKALPLTLLKVSTQLNYLKILSWGYGLLPMGFFFIGAMFLWKEKSKLLLILFFPLLYWLFSGKLRVFYIAYAAPLIPFIAIISAYGVIRTGSFMAQKYRKMIILIFSFLCILQGAVFSIRYDYLLTRTDTRIIARNWIKDNLLPNSKILIDLFGPNLSIYRDINRIGQRINNYSVREFKIATKKKSAEDYRKEGFEYIVINDFVLAGYLFFIRVPSKTLSFYRQISKEEEIFYISPAKKRRTYKLEENLLPFWDIFARNLPGPEIRIYKLRNERN